MTCWAIGSDRMCRFQVALHENMKGLHVLAWLSKQKVIFTCQGCQQKLRAPVSTLGRKAICPRCGGRLFVPILSIIQSLRTAITSLPAAARTQSQTGVGMSRRGLARLMSNKAATGAASLFVFGAAYQYYRTKRGMTWFPDPRINTPIHNFRPFPPDNPWNQVVADAPLDPLSEVIMNSIGRDKPLHPDIGWGWRYGPTGYIYMTVGNDDPLMQVVTEAYSYESDPGPYRIPLDAPIEGGPNGTGDRHVIVVDTDNWMLYELFNARIKNETWHADSGAIFDLKVNSTRTAGWGSADAAGLPIFPGLVRYEEVHEAKVIPHALRFTVKRSRRAYVPPASHFASPHKDVTLPLMGMRVRLRESFEMSKFSEPMQVILTCLKQYGMLLADNGGDMFLNGAYHEDWSMSDLKTLKNVKARDFEVIRMDGLVPG